MYDGIKLALLGGDMRFVALAGMLSARGVECAAWGLGDECDIGGATRCSDWRSAVGGAAAVILPLPVSKDGVRVDCPLSDGNARLRLTTLLDMVGDRIPILCGRITPELIAAAETRGVRIFDYFRSEELQIRNAVPTAEGAVMMAMQALDVTIRGCRAAVTGYGRIGKTLSSLLAAMGAEVTVVARKGTDLAYAASYGFDTVKIVESKTDRGLEPLCSGYDVIFNTVPVKLFDRDLLASMSRKTYILDLASVPGGVDMQAASEYGIRTEWGLSLPGRCFPMSAGAVICETVLGILESERIV